MLVLARGPADPDQLFILHHHVDAAQLLLTTVHVGLDMGRGKGGQRIREMKKLNRNDIMTVSHNNI